MTYRRQVDYQSLEGATTAVDTYSYVEQVIRSGAQGLLILDSQRFGFQDHTTTPVSLEHGVVDHIAQIYGVINQLDRGHTVAITNVPQVCQLIATRCAPAAQ